MILVNLILETMDPISKLAEYFREFPGIGPRQAKRFVYFLLTKNASFLDEISRLILEIKKNIKICNSCFRFFQSENDEVCNICSDQSRNKQELMVVSRDVDFEAIEKSKIYNGLYFILGGNIPILDKEPEKRVRLSELTEKIKVGNFKEIILSLNATAEGEHTTDFLKDYLKDLNLKITILGRGLSTGSELEYVDKETLKSALEHRG
jgi:recombination protein RecR